MIKLMDKQPFSSGLFRDCFLHPDDPTKCIKVAKPRTDANPNAGRESVQRTDDPNALEYAEYWQLMKRGIPIERYRPRLYGFVETDRGCGLCMDLLQSDDGTPPVSLQNYLIKRGRLDGLPHETILSNYREFAAFCIRHAILASSDELSNVGYIRQNGSWRFVAFDMKKRQNLEFIPVSSFIPYFRRKKVRRRFARSQADLEKRLSRLEN